MTMQLRTPYIDVPPMAQCPRGHLSKSMLPTVVVESESVITGRLIAAGYLEMRPGGAYVLTAKGMAIGLAKGKRLYFHVQKTADALGLTPKD